MAAATRSSSGFTLLEVLVVTLVIAILASISFVSFSGALDRAKQRATMSDMRTISRALEAYTGIPRDRWFTGEFEEDPEVPGGSTTRTQTENGACVFLNRAGRGCRLHAFCLERGMDPRELKSMVDFLFPLTFDDGLLHPSTEVDDGSLVCLRTGPTLYRGLRGELEYYFGAGFVTGLDELEIRAPSET